MISAKTVPVISGFLVRAHEKCVKFAKNDTAEATKVWARRIVNDENGHANYGWVDYRDHHLVPEMGEMKNTKYEFSDIKIHLAGNTAWAILKYTVAAGVGEGKTRLSRAADSARLFSNNVTVSGE